MAIKHKLKHFKLVNFNKVIGLENANELEIKNGILIPKTNNEVNNKNLLSFDVSNCIVAPGFIDPQINGYLDCSFWTLDELGKENAFREINKLCEKLAFNGIVAFCPTIITAPHDKIISNIELINSYISSNKSHIGARMLGIHLEGIFISKYGVHDSKFSVKELIVKNIEPFIRNNIAIFTLAPELDKSGNAIKYIQDKNVLVSIGHSNGSYSEGLRAINDYGINMVTHMFNAMSGVKGFSHRPNDSNSGIQLLRSKIEDEKNILPDEDGIMLAALRCKNVLCMAIADGIHISREAVSLLREVKDDDHFSLASDLVSMDFFNKSKLKGVLGGGQTPINDCVSNLIKWNIAPVENALLSGSKPIANQLKTASKSGLGSISYNNEANLVVWDSTKNAVRGTIIGENVFLNY